MYIYIPQEILILLASPKECFLCTTAYMYFVNYVWCLLIVQGRKTTRNMYKHCFFFNKNLSSWSRFLSQYKWDYNKVMEKILHQIVDIFLDDLMMYGALLACYDTTITAKNSKKVGGIQKWNSHSTNADRGEYITGHHFGVAGIIANIKTQFICFILSFRLITGESQHFQFKCSSDNSCEPYKIWDTVHAQILQLNEWLKKYNKPLRVVLDAYFSNKPFIQPLLDKGIHVITRLRDNGTAYLDPEPQPAGKRGPKPKYGKKIKVYDLFKIYEPETITVSVYGKKQNVQVVTANLMMLKLSKKVKVVVVKCSTTKKIAFISTDLSLTAAEIIEIYSSRFSIELSIRDMKQHLGLCDYQHQGLLPVLRHLHLVAVAYNIGKMLLVKSNSINWLNMDNQKDETAWTSEYSFTKLRYYLKWYTLGKIITDDSANTQESNKLSLDKDTIMRIAS